MGATSTDRHVAIGSRIRAARKKRCMRQVDLAESAGLSWRHLIRIEQGEGGEPKPETIERLAEALGVDHSDLTGEDEGEPRSVARLDVFDVLIQALQVAKAQAEQVRA